MITKNIKDASQLKAKLPNVLRDLKKRLGNSMGVKWKLTLKEKTPFSLLFNMSRHSNPKDIIIITVAVLPTFEANVEGNNGMYLFKRKGCNIAFIGSGDRHSLVSARLSEWEAQARIPSVAHDTQLTNLTVTSWTS